jgi:hypothetical protein
MAFWLCRTIVAAAFILCCSCEKHPLGQMPEVQREQPDPAKRVWSKTGEIESEKSSSSATPAEFSPESSPH